MPFVRISNDKVIHRYVLGTIIAMYSFNILLITRYDDSTISAISISAQHRLW